jgi:periplasmic divalent cation tolerance protein
MPAAYATAPPEAAEDIAPTLVEERPAARVNRFDCRSTYRREGGVHDDEEVLLLAKTTEDRYADLAARVEELHPYEVPCVERFEEADVPTALADWRAGAVR